MSAPTSSGAGLPAAVVAQIKAERAARDIPIGELAKRVGIGQRTISRYLSGEREMTLGTIQKFADGLGIDFLELMRLADQRLKQG